MSTASNVKPEWQGISAYILVLFGLTWPVEVLALIHGVHFRDASETAKSTAAFLLLGVSLVPGIAAWIVIATLTKESFRFTGLRFGDWRYYALTWIAVPWLFIVIYLLTALLHLGSFDPTFHNIVIQLHGNAQQYLMLLVAASLSILVVVYAVPVFVEQFGWMGFLLPKLLPLGRWQAALLCGFLRGLWQLPLIAMGYAYPDRVAGYVLIVLYSCALALVDAALRIRSRSVVLPTFFETLVVTQLRGILPLLVVVGAPDFGGAFGLIGIIVFGAAGAYLLATTSQEAVDALCLPPEKAKTPEWLKRRRRR